MRKFDTKIILGVALIVIVLMGIIIKYGFGYNWEKDKDLKIGVFDKQSLGIISVSPQRRMINTLEVNGETKVWLPNGYGWYNAGKVNQLLESEKKTEIKPLVFFYNFGMYPDLVWDVNNFSQWQDIDVWIKNLGLFNYIKFRMMLSDMLVLDEKVEGERIDYRGLGEALSRDFADNSIVGEEVRVSIVNNGTESGVAKWLSQRLEWMGMTVIGLDTGESEAGFCKLAAGNAAMGSKSYKVLKSALGCTETENKNLNDEDIEIMLGQDYSAMVKY